MINSEMEMFVYKIVGNSDEVLVGSGGNLES